MEEADGSIWITETEKTSFRLHKIDGRLLELLWSQFTLATVATAGLVLQVPGPAGSAPLPAGALPANFSGCCAGFSLDLVVANLSQARTGQVLATTAAAGAPGGLSVVAEAAAGGGVALALVLDDGHLAVNLTTDPICAAPLADATRPHYVAFAVDGGPRIITVLVDGKLCDGGGAKGWPRGWAWFPAELGSVRGSGRVVVGGGGGGGVVSEVRVWDRALTTSEMVGNWRAGGGA